VILRTFVALRGVRDVNGWDTDGYCYYCIRIRYHFSDPDLDTNSIGYGYELDIRRISDINTNMNIFWILNKNIICIIFLMYSIL
jgi:hypothetical protein